ncbi:MAG TPA: tetratricopeptide repeat protein [Candidatus Hodarchaeales archaeon]|nr:tetratricopeptide repeat protein [Candidatus Hodarchaeales archaeon]
MDIRDIMRSVTGLVDNEIPLFETALSISLIEFPGLKIEEELERLNSLIIGAKNRIKGLETQELVFRSVNKYFFNDVAFKGNRTDYYDPKNSCLSIVLDTAVGIPITLSVLYLSIVRAVGLNAFGIGFPGNFLIGVQINDKTRIINCFENGNELSSDDLQKLLDVIYDGKLALTSHHLHPISHRLILVRMLNNLKQIYVSKVEYPKALIVLDCICILFPFSAEDQRDRGKILVNLGRYDEAAETLNNFLRLAPDSFERAEVENILAHLNGFN